MAKKQLRHASELTPACNAGRLAEVPPSPVYRPALRGPAGGDLPGRALQKPGRPAPEGGPKESMDLAQKTY